MFNFPSKPQLTQFKLFGHKKFRKRDQKNFAFVEQEEVILIRKFFFSFG
jgi:hypothetical protein